MAKEYVKMGYYIGIGGVVTFKNAKKLKQVVQEIPLESIVLKRTVRTLRLFHIEEKRNSSLYLPYVAEEIAAAQQQKTSCYRRRKTHGSYTDFREKRILEKRKGAGKAKE